MSVEIKAEEVKLDDQGFWDHSEFPACYEGTDISVLAEWFNERDGTHEIQYIEDSLSDEGLDAYYNSATSIWKPASNEHGSFLLSIHHDANVGVIAVFFVPNPKPVADTPFEWTAELIRGHIDAMLEMQ